MVRELPATSTADPSTAGGGRSPGRAGLGDSGDSGGGGGGVWRFGMAEGPVASYERVVRVGPGPADPGGTGAGAQSRSGRPGAQGRSGAQGRPGASDGSGTPLTGGSAVVEVSQEVRFRVGIPYVSWIFALPLLANLGGLSPAGKAPWWAPPERVDHRRAVALAGLCGFAVLAGYLDGLLPATATYIGREYHVGDAGQGYALAGVQSGALLALGILVAADRWGRRRSVVATTVAGALASLAAAACPSLAAVALTQVAATAVLGAQYVLLGVSVVELMPSGARAWALALLTMSYGLGGGVTLLALPLAGLGVGGWRWLYVLAGLAVAGAIALSHHVPETERWKLHAGRDGQASPLAGRASSPAGRASRWTPEQRRRLLLLGAVALLFALFSTPATQFQNQYLRVQRHWSPVHISLAEQVVGTLGAAGTLAGGRLADTRGRRPVLALALAAGTAATLLEYLTRGTALYGWMTASSLLGYAVTPALAVYGAEMFPTGLRGRAGGVLNVLGAAGGLAGLAATGAIAGAVGSLGPALAVTAAGPALVVLLVIVAYPETARRSLEEINPGDLPVATGLTGPAGTVVPSAAAGATAEPRNGRAGPGPEPAAGPAPR